MENAKSKVDDDYLPSPIEVARTFFPDSYGTRNDASTFDSSGILDVFKSPSDSNDDLPSPIEMARVFRQQMETTLEPLQVLRVDKNDLATIQEIVALYGNVKIDPTRADDRQRFAEQGGMLITPSAEELQATMHHPGFEMYIARGKSGAISAVINLDIPIPSDNSSDSGRKKTLFDPAYREHISNGNQDWMHTKLQKTVWIGDLISVRTPEGRGKGKALLIHILKQMQSRGFERAIAQILRLRPKSQDGEIPDSAINMSSSMIAFRTRGKLQGEIDETNNYPGIVQDDIQIKSVIYAWDLSRFR